MGHVQDNAEESVRRVLDVLKDGQFAYPMDSGAQIKVEITVDKGARQAVIDFTGTSCIRTRATTTRPRRSAARWCSTSSARWSARTSR